MTVWVGLLAGLLIGWLIEWAIDWWWWRRSLHGQRERYRAAETARRRLETELADAQQKLDRLRTELAQARGQRASGEKAG